LLVVSGLFFVEGIMAAADATVSLYFDTLTLNVGMLGLPIAYGLVKRRSGWRTVALIWNWIGIAGAALTFGLLLFTNEPIIYSRHQTVLFTISNPVAEVLAGAALLIAFWRWRVLIRPSVRSLFGSPPPAFNPIASNLDAPS